MKQTVWIVGETTSADGHAWSLIAVCSTEQKAKDACKSVNHFVAPIEIDGTPDYNVSQWNGVYYPLAARNG